MFDCKKLTGILTQVSEKTGILDIQLNSNGDVADVLIRLQKEIEIILEPAVDWFGGDQVGVRNEIAMERGYAYVEKFNKYGLAVAKLEDGWNPPSILVNLAGERVIPKEADNEFCRVSEFSEGIASVSTKEGSYYIKENGERLNDKVYREALPYKFGRALVQYATDPKIDKDPTRNSDRIFYHVVDQEGNELHTIDIKSPDQPMDMRWSNKGFIGLHRTAYGAWYITPEGKRIPEDSNKYFEDGMGDLNLGIAKVCDRLGQGQTGRKTMPHEQTWYYIDQEGRRLNEGIFAQELRALTDFYNGRAYVEKLDGDIILTDIHGKILKKIGNVKEIGDMNSRIRNGNFSDGMLMLNHFDHATKVSISRIFDYNGNLVTDEFSDLARFSEGLAFGRKDGKKYLFDKDLNLTELTEPVYNIEPFKDGVAKADYAEKEKDDRGFEKSHKVYIDKKGRRVFS